MSARFSARVEAPSTFSRVFRISSSYGQRERNVRLGSRGTWWEQTGARGSARGRAEGAVVPVGGLTIWLRCAAVFVEHVRCFFDTRSMSRMAEKRASLMAPFSSSSPSPPRRSWTPPFARDNTSHAFLPLLPLREEPQIALRRETRGNKLMGWGAYSVNRFIGFLNLHDT